MDRENRGMMDGDVHEVRDGEVHEVHQDQFPKQYKFLKQAELLTILGFWAILARGAYI